MSLPLYMGHNVIGQITTGCLSRGLDVLTALEDGFDDRQDGDVLARATELGRVVFTHDTDFIAITGEWLATGRPFAGVVYGHQFRVSIGKAIGDLEVICHHPRTRSGGRGIERCAGSAGERRRRSRRGIIVERQRPITMHKCDHHEGCPMNAIRVRKKLDSDTLHLPELKPLIGRTVEIVVQEADTATQADPYQQLFELAGADAVDPEAYKRLRAASTL